MLVFKYLLRVFKYLTAIIQWKKCALSLITVHILGLHDFAELSKDQRHMSKIFWQLIIHGWNPNEWKFINTVKLLIQAVREAATICPAHCKLISDLLTSKVVSESRVKQLRETCLFMSSFIRDFFWACELGILWLLCYIRILLFWLLVVLV